MLNRVAVLSDIHGVLPALDAVLAEPEVSAADRIVLTGDITAGPQPTLVLDRLTSLGDRVVWISGNADRELVEYRRGRRDSIPDPIAPWAAEQLRRDHIDLLDRLPQSISLPVRGLGKVLFCHATPRNDEEVVLVDSRLDRWREVLSGVDTDIRAVVCGHTHMPFVRLVDGLLVINPGSIGMPYGRAGAHWALLAPASNYAPQPSTSRQPSSRSPRTPPTPKSPSGPTTSSTRERQTQMLSKASPLGTDAATHRDFVHPAKAAHPGIRMTTSASSSNG